MIDIGSFRCIDKDWKISSNNTIRKVPLNIFEIHPHDLFNYRR